MIVIRTVLFVVYSLRYVITNTSVLKQFPICRECLLANNTCNSYRAFWYDSGRWMNIPHIFIYVHMIFRFRVMSLLGKPMRWWSGIAISMWRKSIGNWTKRFTAWIHGNRNSSLLSLCRKACFVTVYLFNNIIISFNVQVN